MATDPDEPLTQQQAGALVAAALTEKGPEFLIANELPRLWATGAQAFVNGGHSMLIFREQNVMAGPAIGDAEPTTVLKNVASIVLPTGILAEFYDNLAPAIEAWKATQAGTDGSPAE